MAVTLQQARDIAAGGQAAKTALDAIGFGTTASSTELDFLDGVLADGVAVASKALVLGATKNIDTIDVTAGGLKIGAVAMTSTAAELNFLDTAVAGTAVASKAAVLGANKDLDTLRITKDGFLIDATAVTTTAAELNFLDTATAGTAVASKAMVLGAGKNIDTLDIDAAGFKIATVAVTPTAAQINTLTKQGRVNLDITALRLIATNDIDNLAAHGGIVALDSTPKLERVNAATDKSLRVVWAAANVDEVQFPPVMMPPDMDGATDLTVHLLFDMSGATDTPVVDVQVWEGVGDTEMGGNTGALSSTLSEETVTVANANLSGAPLGFLNINLVPAAHGTDAIWLYGAWIEYTRV